MIGYDFHPEARADLDEIWDYIAPDNIDAAVRVVDEVLQRIKALVPFPHTGHRRPDLTDRPLRFIRVRNYLIAYAPDSIGRFWVSPEGLTSIPKNTMRRIGVHQIGATLGTACARLAPAELLEGCSATPTTSTRRHGRDLRGAAFTRRSTV